MQTISKICAVIVAVSMVASIVLLFAWLIKLVRKKQHKRTRTRLIVSLTCFVVFTIAGVLTAPSTWCDHEYKLVDSLAATCEKDGFKKYHCDLCNSSKTDKLKKLGHDMVEVRHVMPTYKTDGEYVKQCTRCGYEEIEALDKLAQETPKPTAKPKETTEPSAAPTATPAPTVKPTPSPKPTATPTPKPTVKPTPTPKPVKPSEEVTVPEQTVTYDDIYRAYKENVLLADDLYKNNRYQITARVTGMSNDGLFNLTGGAILTMEKRVGNTIVYFYAEFEREQEDALKTIKVGEIITFEGECLSAGMWVDCELIKE